MESAGITLRESHGIAIVDLQGKLELYNLTEVQKTVESLIDAGKHKVIFNLEKVPYLDSHGVGGFFLLAKRLRALNGDLKLLNLTVPVQALLQLTRVIPLIETYTSEAAALAAFTGKPGTHRT